MFIAMFFPSGETFPRTRTLYKCITVPCRLKPTSLEATSIINQSRPTTQHFQTIANDFSFGISLGNEMAKCEDIAAVQEGRDIPTGIESLRQVKPSTKDSKGLVRGWEYLSGGLDT
jgi:hypothetical protein